jgi:ribosome biogenesis GTPase A
MKILIFTEGTLLMHSEGTGVSTEARVQQSKDKITNVKDFARYIPIGNAQAKLRKWQSQGNEIFYLTSRKTPKEINDIQNVLDRFDFPKGRLLYRKENEDYKDVAEQLMPDIIIEDDCESIGGEIEMTYPNINEELKQRIKSVVVKEFGGIDHLPDNL